MNQNQKENWQERLSEIVERIVVDYANFSGRDITHRAEFRDVTEKRLESFISTELEKQASELTAWAWKEIEKAQIEQKKEIVEMIKESLIYAGEELAISEDMGWHNKEIKRILAKLE